MMVTWAEACAPLLKVGWAFDNLAVSIRLVFLCLLGIALPLTLCAISLIRIIIIFRS